MKIEDIENIIRDHTQINNDNFKDIYWGYDKECTSAGIEAWYREEFGIEEKSFNEHGYRSDSFDKDNGFLFLGCSITFGYGLKREESWPWIVGKHFNVPVWNLGVIGQGDDVCFLNANKWIPKLKPKVVCMLLPPPGRFKFFDIDDENLNNQFSNWKIIQREKEMKFPWLFNDKNLYIHTLKNILSIKTLCDEYNIPFILKPILPFLIQSHGHKVGDPNMEPIDDDDITKDGLHPGPKWHQRISNEYIKEIEKCI